MISAIVAGAGVGQRMGTRTPKIFLKLNGMPLGYYAVRMLAGLEEIDRIFLAVPHGRLHQSENMAKKWQVASLQIFEGADTRQDTVYKALQFIPRDTKIVLIHDAARPLASADLIRSVIAGAREHGACVPTLPSEETIKLVRGGRVTETLSRDEIHSVQTPQAFYYDVILEAHRHAFERKWRVTDDATLVERIGRPVAAVSGERSNIKVTHPIDLKVARLLMRVGPEH